jgi:hypothetical protein
VGERACAARVAELVVRNDNVNRLRTDGFKCGGVASHTSHSHRRALLANQLMERPYYRRESCIFYLS